MWNSSIMENSFEIDLAILITPFSLDKLCDYIIFLQIMCFMIVYGSMVQLHYFLFVFINEMQNDLLQRICNNYLK